MNPGLMGLVGAPTYPMLRDATQRTLFEILDVEEIGYVYHKQENKLTIDDNGSSIIFRTLDNPDRLRGPNLAWFGVDELTYCKWSGWEKLEGRLRDPRANRLCGFAAWTPNGFDNVYESFISAPKPGYRAVLASPRENFHVANTGFYDRLESSYDERLYRQEVLGEYLALRSGAAYYAFDRNIHVKPVEYDPRYPLLWSLDFNIGLNCSVIAQRVGEELRVLEELVLPQAYTLDACNEFLERTKRWAQPNRQMPVYYYGDATGRQRDTAGPRTDWQIISEFFGRNQERFAAGRRVDTTNPQVKDRVNCVNARLRNYFGESNVKIDPRCKSLVKDFERVTWKMDPNENILADIDKTDPMLTHISDAFGYLVYKEFPMRAAVGEKAVYTGL